MCGYSNTGWSFNLAVLFAFGVLIAASVALLVRSMDRKPGEKQGENS
jgi:hypothetical protein